MGCVGLCGFYWVGCAGLVGCIGLDGLCRVGWVVYGWVG